MAIDKSAAEQELREIDRVRTRTVTMRNYRQFAPHAILWGVIWLLANSVTQFAPEQAGVAWLIGVVAGGFGSGWLGHRAQRAADAARENEGWRWALAFLVLAGYFTALFSILPPQTGAQTGAVIALFWMLLYMLTGIWLGWKVFALGLVTSALLLFGYFQMPAYFALWMAVAGGGALIIGGLWLRRI